MNEPKTQSQVPKKPPGTAPLKASTRAPRQRKSAGSDAALLPAQAAAPAPITPPVVLISGVSGSGKSVALNALEDAGYFCVDNLPPELLPELIRLQRAQSVQRIAVAVDVRNAASLPKLLPLLDRLRDGGVRVLPVFLESRTDALVRRFSETRRRHPLSTLAGEAGQTPSALIDAIELERELLAELRDISTVIDTSDLRALQLRNWIRQLVGASHSGLTLVFESFAFKHGVPSDADLVYDLRVLPNPHYVRELRALTGRDAGVIDFMRGQPEAAEMLTQIEAFLTRWLPSYATDQRSYLTVALGCTGGQHRSVYGVEQLARAFRAKVPTLVRHREIEAREAQG